MTFAISFINGEFELRLPAEWPGLSALPTNLRFQARFSVDDGNLQRKSCFHRIHLASSPFAFHLGASVKTSRGFVTRLKSTLSSVSSQVSQRPALTFARGRKSDVAAFLLNAPFDTKPKDAESG